MNTTIKDSISLLLQQHGVTHFGWTKLSRPLSMDMYAQWIHENHQADMDYLKSHLNQKENSQLFKKAHSAIVFCIPYFPHPWPDDHKMSSTIALYAQGKDYHHEIPKKIAPIIKDLKSHFMNDEFELYTDSAPILERDLAYRAGLGWIGKNTCLIHPKRGSLFFIAEIYTTLELENENPWSPDFCGSCNKCIEACPTQALTAPRKLEPNKCISYWTIESKNVAPETLRPYFKDWLFGCDICQTVCPWNQKHLKQRVTAFEEVLREEKIKELHWILTSSRKSLFRFFANTPLARAAGWKLQRNAIVVATNQSYGELIPVIQPFIKDEKLSELANWSLSILKSDSSL